MINIKGRELAILKRQYSRLKQRNKKFGSEVLSLCEYITLVNQPCHYCGVEFSRMLPDSSTKNARRFHSTTVVHINSIDRVSSNLGYTLRNSTSCCNTCNTAKNTMSKVEFLKWVKKAYKHLHC